VIVLPESQDVPRKVPIHRTGLWIVLMMVFMGQLLCYAWCRIQCINIGYEIQHQMNEYDQLILLQNTLKIELERLRSPDRIARIARNQLQMVTPSPQQKQVVLAHEHPTF